MKIKEKQQIMIDKEVDVRIICDECRREIRNRENINKRLRGSHYYEVTTHHHDWGNDSIDSYKYLDFCSFECMVEYMKRYYESGNGSESYDVERTW